MTNDLIKFLIKTASEGYASGNESAWTKENDASTTIEKAYDDWKIHDNFFGGEPYGGREVIFYKGSPYWIMVYYGNVSKDVVPDEVYKILRFAIANPDKEMPIRGPKSMTEGNFEYSFKYSGNIENFSAEESIRKNGKELYKAKFLGGLIDQRKGI